MDKYHNQKIDKILYKGANSKEGVHDPLYQFFFFPLMARGEVCRMTLAAC